MFDSFDIFYKEFKSELNKRCFFIEYKGEKVATATISPSNEYGYSCVIDWLAIKKEYQGKGLARPLISKFMKIAFDEKYGFVDVCCNEYYIKSLCE